MLKKHKWVPIIVVLAVLIGLVAWYFHRTNIPILEPAGTIGDKERSLIFIALILSVIVVVPTFALAIFVAVKYRESNHIGNKKVKYSPDWDHSRLFEGLWWGVPTIIITILSVITWQSSHALDPYKPIASNQKVLTIQVVGLNWKWLFIYPKQQLASINLAVIPTNRPVDFEITSDTVMNSFWIPQLGGQIYAMPGMITNLNEEAIKEGSYNGSAANISGRGFASMTFTVKATSDTGFDNWVHNVRVSTTKYLGSIGYKSLAKPSLNGGVQYYSSVEPGLFNQIVDKYMTSGRSGPSGLNATNQYVKSRQNSMPAMKGAYSP